MSSVLLVSDLKSHMFLDILFISANYDIAIGQELISPGQCAGTQNSTV
jgi:hypothetical protein